MSNFYIVATPIGNLEDITLRALRVLKEVDFILCEDTRVTRKLLDHYDIKTKTESYHSNSTPAKIKKVKRLVKEGREIALVSDSGTPGVSDPGSALLRELRKEEINLNIVPIPGASALTTALSVSSIASSSFVFYGFLPKKKRRETIFEEIANSKKASILYESPHRILKTLSLLEKKIGNRKIFIAREISKIYEQFISDTPANVIEYFKENPKKIKGEFVLMVEGKPRAF